MIYLSTETAKELIKEANQLGIRFTLYDNDIVTMKAKETPPPELMDKLKQCKPFIIQVLGNRYITIEDLPRYGLEPLPDDYRFLAKEIPKGFNGHELLSLYVEHWINGMINEPVEHKQQNAGRREANLLVVRHNKALDQIQPSLHTIKITKVVD